MTAVQTGASELTGRPRAVPVAPGFAASSPAGADAAVTESRPTVRRCISGSTEDFARDVWSRQPMLTPGADPAGFADLFSADAVDELVSTRGLRTPFLRMARDGSVRATSTFTRSGGAGATITDQVADDKVLAQLAAGSTLVLQALHRTWPPLVEFGSRLAAELGHPVQINAYITPPQNQGFSPHYDTHDVFVLQIAGTKQWTIHAPVLDAPLPDQPWDRRRAAVAARAEEEPLLSTVLTPGDALYLPRGFLHSAVAQGDVSIHLTVGVHPITGFDLARELIAVAAGDPELRRSLPMGFDADQLTAAVRSAAARLADDLAQVPEENVSATVQRTQDRLRADTRPQPIAPLAQLAAAAGLVGTDRIRLREGLRPRLTDRGDRVVLWAVDSSLELPAVVRPALQQLLSGGPVTVADLPGLDADEQLVLARRLLREGLAVPLAADDRIPAGS